MSTPSPGVRVVHLNHPEIRNALTEEMRRDWDAALDLIEADEDVRVLVVTGTGGSFCSGADLSWLDEAEAAEITPDRIRRRIAPFYRSWLRLGTLPFPTIAAINGPTVGAGLALALCCELRYSHTSARFSAPFLHLGTHPGIAITHTLAASVGDARAKEMFYTGRSVSAEEAHEWGLTLGVFDDVLSHALDVATGIAAAAPIATRLLKQGLDTVGSSIAEATEWESLAQSVTLATRDLHEGVRAFTEGRSPRFRGE
ncbi:MAG: enoyl-CoA hydratase/isomerase family protein [Microbacterium sp.]